MVEQLPTGQKQVIDALVYSVIFLVLIAIVLILFFYYSRRTIVLKDVEKMNTKLEHQNKILETTINVQEEERKRIAQDLHDAISSKLNVVSLTTNVLLEEQSIEEEHKKALNHILDITMRTLESTRKIAHELLPPILDKFGLKVALIELFDEFTSNTNIKITYNFDELNYLNKTSELHVFRIIQELINNALRHGKADLLKISLKRKNGEFDLIFKDNGKGYNVNESSKNMGLGLQGIRSRVSILDGQLTINSSKTEGSAFTINCKIHDT